MKKKVLIGLVVMAVATLAFVPAASAEGPRPGTLTAHGDGVAVLDGGGSVKISGRGILWFKDVAGDAEWTVSGHGEKREFSNGWIEYLGFHGHFEVTGSHFIIILSGNNIDLWARGRGRCFLWGQGEYHFGPR
ncbi:MAG: hypothetical protein SVX38_05835, partial [Chloroflexota bacterium]|nr:hypothetical protein [Chloroflexota bacterium]